MTIATNQPQTIARKKAGALFPKEFLETALRHCPVVSGFAIRDVTDGKVTLETGREDKPLTVSALQELTDTAKPYETVLYLANLTSKFDKTDIQPFTLAVRESEESPPVTVVAFFIEGDFPKFSDPASGHTDEANLSTQVVLPMLEELFTDCEGDIAKFTARLHKDSFKKNLMAHIGHRGTFLFLPLEGDPIAFGENTLGGEFEWGETSQIHGFGVQKPANPITSAVAQAAGVVKSKFMFGKPKEEPVIKTDDNGIHHVPEKKINPAELPAPKTDTAVLVALSPPPKLEQNARNMWIRLFNGGELPKNHHIKDLKIMVDPDLVPLATREVLTKQDMKSLEADVKKFKAGKPVDMKAAAPKPVASGQPPIVPAARSAGDFIPDMTDKEMVEMTGILAGFVDRDKVPNALEIQKLEAKWPTFSEKMGIPFADIFRYLVADVMAITGGNKAATMLILELRRALMNKMDVSELINTAPKVTQVGGTKIVETHIAAKEILKPEPKKAGGFLFGRKTG